MSGMIKTCKYKYKYTNFHFLNIYKDEKESIKDYLHIIAKYNITTVEATL